MLRLKKNLITLAISFTAILTSGCGHLPSWAPQPPVVNRCSYTFKFKKFRCTNSATNVVTEYALNDPTMEGAQALSLPDYNAGQKWLDDFLAKSREHCEQ